MKDTYVEGNCTVRFGEHEYTAGGAMVTDAALVAYIGKREEGRASWPVTTWHGEEIGRAVCRSTWKTPRFFTSSTMSTWIVRLKDGRVYSAYGAGEGCILRGRAAGKEARKVAALIE